MHRQPTATTATPTSNIMKLPAHYRDITAATAITTQNSILDQNGSPNPLTMLTREYSEMLASRIRASQSRVRADHMLFCIHSSILKQNSPDKIPCA